MSAQIPQATVNDYLSEVRIFPPGTADFAQIAAKLGVDATLPTLGAGARLVVAIRNDSGGEVGANVLFQVTKNGRTQPHDLTLGLMLGAGDSALLAPREVSGPLAMMLHPPGKPGLFGFTGSPTGGPLDYYEGATVTASVDSATLADGKFIGADTQKLYDQLVANDKAERKFFSDVAALLSAGKTQAEIEQVLTARASPNPNTPTTDMPTGATLRRMTPADLPGQGTATPPDAPTPAMMPPRTPGVTGRTPGVPAPFDDPLPLGSRLNLAARTELGFYQGALMKLKYFGMASLTSWVAQENSKLAAKPERHK